MPFACSLCCVFLAFKVDEYNLSLDQFVHMLAPHLIQSTSEYIISHEVSSLLFFLSLRGTQQGGGDMCHARQAYL